MGFSIPILQRGSLAKPPWAKESRLRLSQYARQLNCIGVILWNEGNPLGAVIGPDGPYAKLAPNSAVNPLVSTSEGFCYQNTGFRASIVTLPVRGNGTAQNCDFTIIARMQGIVGDGGTGAPINLSSLSGAGNIGVAFDVSGHAEALSAGNSGAGRAVGTTVYNSQFVTIGVQCDFTDSHPNVFENGVLTGTAVASSGSNVWSGPLNLAFGQSGQTCLFEYVFLFASGLSAAEHFFVARNPWSLLELSSPLGKVSAGGSVYNVSQAESVTAADLYASLVAMAANDAETATMSDAPVSTAILPSAVGEVGSEADLVSNGSIYPVAVAEVPSLADLLASQAVLAAPDAESGSAVDAPATTAILPSTQPESAPLVDAPSTKAVLPSAVGETAAQADLVNGALLVPGAVPEAASALDAPSTKAILPSAVGEAASATDVENAPPPGVETVAEVATAADLVSAQVIAGGGQAESAPLVDAPSARLVSPAAIAESSALADLVAAQANFAAALVELGFAADLPAARMIMATGLLEAGAAQDSPSADAAKIAAAKCNTLGSAERIRVLGSDTRIRILGGDCC